MKIFVRNLFLLASTAAAAAASATQNFQHICECECVCIPSSTLLCALEYTNPNINMC